MNVKDFLQFYESVDQNYNVIQTFRLVILLRRIKFKRSGEHTHFLSHEHDKDDIIIDVTPEEIEYGYFNTATEAHRVTTFIKNYGKNSIE